MKELAGGGPGQQIDIEAIAADGVGVEGRTHVLVELAPPKEFTTVVMNAMLSPQPNCREGTP